MKILSPLDSIDEVERLAEAGAGSFYCGLLDEAWHQKYPVISINRRPAGRGHFRTFDDLRSAVELAHDRGIPVYFALNEHYYIQEQYDRIQKYVDGAVESGVDAFIVADYGLIAYLNEVGCSTPLHLSTGGAVFNRRAASFFIDNGITNITFPRHLEIAELSELIASIPPVESTVFILNSRCVNIDGYCTFQHGLAGKEILPMFRNACMLPFDVRVICNHGAGLQVHEQAALCERQRIWEQVHVDDHPCGACALFDFREMGIDEVKIVGRGNTTDRKIRDTAFIKNLIDRLANEQPERDEFREASRNLYRKTYSRECRFNMCYYPGSVFED